MTCRGEPITAPLAPLAWRAMRRAVVAAMLVAAIPGCAPQSSTAADPETVTLAMTEYRFTPDHLVFKQGGTYRLVLENRGKELHEFTAPEFVAAITVDDPAVLTADNKEIVVRPGERKELRFVARRAGRFPLRCADHDWTGMVGEITIR